MDGIPNRGKIGLLVIDMQEKFKPVIPGIEDITDNISKLIKGFSVYGLPIMFTEQYPKGLGSTFPKIKEMLEEKPIEKMEFSCFKNKEFKEKIRSMGIDQLLICGIEAHVCVLQTALDAIAEGFEVFLVEDAVSSRKEMDKKTAVERAAQSGVYRVSTEMIIFQLMERAGSEEFKEIQEIIK
jgi:nicotinamidase-related amidase